MESLLESRSLGEESLQMWDLNKRLEAYLVRVKFLEEENEVLKSEIHRLKGSLPEGSWMGKYDEEVAALRATLDQAFREKHAADLARASLHEEVQLVKSRCQKERAAHEEAKKLLSLSKKEVEEEKRNHIWLRERATQLEKEMEVLVEAHQEETARLGQEVASFSWSLERFRGTPVAFQPLEVEDYSRRLTDVWRGAVETYKAEVSQLEASLGEAKENLWKATESNQQNQLQLQHLERELAGLRGRKEMLEEHLAQQWQHQQGEAEKLQVAMEGLEEEKQALTTQITQVLEDRRQLMHLKMSLSLEVATYRTLLEAESTRLQMPADHRLALSLQDSKMEASKSKHQGVSLERGPRGSRDPRPSSTAFLKGSVTSQPPKSQSNTFRVNRASVFPKSSRSLVVREFQKANTVLQSQSTKAFDGVDSSAFKLGSSLQNEVATATEAGTVSQSFVHESPPLFNSIRPTISNILGESSLNAEQSHHPGEDRDDISAQIKTEELGKKEECNEKMEEEEKQHGEEPPWKAAHHGSDPSQLVTEALEMALREVPGGDICFEVGLLSMTQTPNGIPSDESLSMEEENGAAISSSTAALGEATPELRKSKMEDLPEGINGSEDSDEAHSGPKASTWLSRDAEPSSPEETELLEKDRSPSTQENKEDVVFDIPVTEGIERCHKTSTLEQAEGGNEQPPNFQRLVWRDDLEEGSMCPERDPGAAVTFRADRGSPEPGLSCPEDHTGATGADLEETNGGVEDLEVVSTEALHLSEDEERRALSSPSRGSEECDFQAEMLESEFLQTEEFAVEDLSPISHAFYFGGHQEHHFLGVEQETPKEQTPFSKSDSAFPEEEEKEVELEPEISSLEEAVLRDERSSIILSAEPWAMEKAGAEEEHTWGPQQDIMGHEGLLEEEDALGREDTMEKKEMAGLQDGTCEQETVLQKKNVESVPKNEPSKGEQGDKTVEVCQEDLPANQQMEEEEITTKAEHREETVKVCQSDHPVDQQVEEEEIITKVEQGEETAEVCQSDLPANQQMEEEEITIKAEQIVECQGDLPVDQQMEEEEIITKAQQGEETVRVCQGELPVDQRLEEEEITTKGEQGEEVVEACQHDLPVDERVEEEEIATKAEQGEETVSVCQGELPADQQVEEEEITTKGEQGEERQGDLPVEQQMEEEEITTKAQQGEETVEACQGDLPVEQQMEEEEIITKADQGEETVRVCHGELPVDHQVEEEEITTKGQQGEEAVEVCQGDLPANQQVEEEGITTKGEQGEETVEVCQDDLPVDQQMEEEEIATKGDQGEETVEVCQDDLPVDQQVEEEEIITKVEQGEETFKVCQDDLPVDQQMEEEEITTKAQQGEETVETCQEDLLVDQPVEEEEITTKGEQGEATVEVCQDDLPVDQRVEEEEIATKGKQGEETVEVCQDDLPVDQRVEEEEIATKGDQGEETVVVCQVDLPVDQQVKEEDITTEGEQQEETVKVCQGDLEVEQQEKEITMASPESDLLKREVLVTGSEAMEAEEMEAKTSLVEKEETVGHVSMSHLQEKENPEVKQAFKTDIPQEEEQHVTAEGEETYQDHHSLLHKTSFEVSEAPSEVQSNATNGFEAQSYSGPQDMDMPSSESDPQLQSDYSGSEVSLESLEVSPNATCETEGIEKELESSKHIKLEETLPDNTPLHLYDENMLVVTGKGQRLPESEEAAGTPPLTKDRAGSPEAMEHAVEEVCPYSSQTENEDAQVLEGVEEKESAPKQDPPNSEELPVPKDLEETRTETSELIRNNEEDQPSREPEMPNTEANFPPLGAEFDEQPGEALKHGSAARKEPVCEEMTHEEICSTDFVWETELDNMFQADQPDPSYVHERVRGGNDSPFEFSDPNNIASEGSHKVSPLTSVADLGEIVLEEEQFQDGQRDTAESEGFVYYEDESLLAVRESQPISDLESSEREDPTQQTDLAEINSGGMDFTDPSPTAEVSLPMDSLKASEILEIVEQALEFNQEVIKAVGQTAEAEQLSARGDAPPFPEAWSNSSSLPSSDAGRPQVFTETPSAPFPSAKDPTGSGHLWGENDGNSLQKDSRLPHFPTETLNGLGDLHSGHGAYDVGSSGEELIDEVAIGQHVHREDLDDPSVLEAMNQNPPQTLTDEEAPRTGETVSEIHKMVSVEHGGQDGLNVEKSLFANIMQSAHAKAKDVEMETVSIPPHFGEDILHLESSQHLKLRPEDEEDFWSPEDS